MENDKTWFVVSDVHSFNKELRTALAAAGYDRKNVSHRLIVLGDIFDRGPDPVGVYNFIKYVPKSRRVLVKGNHEELFLDLLEKDFPDEYDFANKTVDTFCKIAGADIGTLRAEYWYESLDVGDAQSTLEHAIRVAEDIGERMRESWRAIRDAVKETEIAKFIASGEWRDYFELGDYVLVHSFIPVASSEKLSGKSVSYDPNWREGDWASARWGCPWLQYMRGLFAPEEKAGKTLVCGHWNTSDFFKHLGGRFVSDSIYRGSGIIAIDGGVYGGYDWREGREVLTHFQNVLVIEGGTPYEYDFALGALAPLEDISAESARGGEYVSCESWWLPAGFKYEDICYCSADCKAKCARNEAPAGVYTMSDFSAKCDKYEKKGS